MSLVPKEILLSHLQRAEGAEEVTLPIDFFRDMLYQAMPRTWVGLNLDERAACYEKSGGNLSKFADQIEAKLMEKNT